MYFVSLLCNYIDTVEIIELTNYFHYWDFNPCFKYAKITFNFMFTREELESKFKENKMTSNDFDQIMSNQTDAEKYRQLKEKMNEVESDSYLLDRLEACDTSGAAEILRTFLESK